ncbi:hypothetical protein FACS1894176_08020 [Bacteroidia bacterium]|nr:hypothetical protein FACS1894176_08020 [Bacteroidia bacterium]
MEILSELMSGAFICVMVIAFLLGIVIVLWGIRGNSIIPTVIAIVLPVVLLICLYVAVAIHNDTLVGGAYLTYISVDMGYFVAVAIIDPLLDGLLK